MRKMSLLVGTKRMRALASSNAPLWAVGVLAGAGVPAAMIFAGASASAVVPIAMVCAWHVFGMARDAVESGDSRSWGRIGEAEMADAEAMVLDADLPVARKQAKRSAPSV